MLAADYRRRRYRMGPVDKLGRNINGPAYLYVNVELPARPDYRWRATVASRRATLARLRLTQSPEFTVIIAPFTRH